MPISDEPAPPLAVSLLGPFFLQVNGAPLPRLGAWRKQEAILALLILRHPRPLERAWLAGLLWPDSSASQASYNLRRYLTDLRRALGPQAARLHSPTPACLALDLTGAVIDLLAFDAALARADPQSLEQAVALYQGPLLEGWTEEWVFQERQVREQAYLGALEKLAAMALAAGELGTAECYLRRAVAVDPLRESAQRSLMQALATGGNYAAVLQTYRELRLRLHRELNAEPDPETAALFQKLRQEARRKAVGSGAGSAGGGQVADERLLDVRSNNLPQQVTSFIGREQEIAEVKRLLANTRLLTLTGSGGTGKTRVALQVAADLLSEYEDGVWLVELAPLADPTLVPQAVATALAVREQPGQPLIQTLAEVLKPKRLLLVLDNCEHLLAACAALADTALRSCAGVRLLATSREGLNIAGETTYRLPGLSLPDPRNLPPTLESLSQYEAVRLFIDRATAAVPAFRVTNQNAPAVAQVCSRLDGIPLAIELAAARLKALPVEKINERLDDRFRLLTGGSRTALPRQQTLRALIDWSYDLLSEPERILFYRLSVFAGGWTLEAAEAVGGDDAVETWEVLDLLTALVEKSLVIYEEAPLTLRETDAPPGRDLGPGRYRLLETVRQYARERLLESSEEVALRGRHLAFFTRFARPAEPGSPREDTPVWLDRLESEHDNLRAALDGASAAGEAELGLELAGALGGFWRLRGYYSEGRERLARLLDLTQGNSPRTAARARALDCAGFLAWEQGDLDQAYAFQEESLSIRRDLGNREEIAAALHGLARVLEHQGNLQAARALHQEGLLIMREIGNPAQIAYTLYGLGWVALKLGEHAVARDHFEEGLALCRNTSNKIMIAWGLRNLGEVAYLQRDWNTARARYAESLPIMEASGHRWGLVSLLGTIGALALDEGDYGRARSFLRRSLALTHELGLKARLAKPLMEALAELLQREGEPEQAARLLGAAACLPEAVGASVYLTLARDTKRTAASTRAALGEEAFAAAWAEGQGMNFEQAMAEALRSADPGS